MALAVLGMVAEMELGFIRDRSARASTPRRRRAFTGAVMLPEAIYGDAHNREDVTAQKLSTLPSRVL